MNHKVSSIHAAANYQLQIPARRETQKCETNPIPVRARHAMPQLYETNPIYVPDYVERTQFRTTRISQAPKNTKQTQLPHTRCPTTTCFCETKPIPPTSSVFWLLHSPKKMRNEPNFVPPVTPCPTQKMRNKPNPSPHCHPERRAAERSAAAQSRGIRQITIAEGDSLPVTATTPTKICKTNPITASAPQSTIRNIQSTILTCSTNDRHLPGRNGSF